VKVFLTLIIGFNILFANQLVPITVKDVNWKAKIDKKDYKLTNITERFKCKEYLDVIDLKMGLYRAKHYLLKNRPICLDDVYITKSSKVRFNFGTLQIEKEGEIIKETDKYIKIKNLDGKIEKIYKDEIGQ
jgi:hypothetical protein